MCRLKVDQPLTNVTQGFELSKKTCWKLNYDARDMSYAFYKEGWWYMDSKQFLFLSHLLHKRNLFFYVRSNNLVLIVNDQSYMIEYIAFIKI